MNPLLYMLSGAAALAVAYGVYIGGRKLLEAAGALTAALKGIPELVEANRQVAESLTKFSVELEFLRTAVVGGTPKFGPGNEPEEPAAPRRTPTPYPGAPPIFTPVPDAEENETLIIDTTDQEYAEQERLEEVRGMGFEAEPEGNPPGVERNV